MRIGFSILSFSFLVLTSAYALADGDLPIQSPLFDSLTKAGTAPAAGSVATAISAESLRTGQELLSAANGTLSNAIQIATTSTPAPAVPYSFTASSLTALQTKIQSYVSTTKKACASAAETAGFMCIESTSPGAVAAKGIMELAGPALATTNSVNKSCNDTAKVTDLVGKGLALAKGACIAMKTACDLACTTATADLNAINAMIGKLTADLTTDFLSASEYCGNLTLLYAECQAANVAKRESLSGAILALKPAVAKEAVPASPGTTPFIAAKCQMHATDIAQFGLNIFNIMQSSASAKACAAKTAGGNGSAAEYCKLPANSATTFCVCLKDNKAEGCSGYVAKTSDSIKLDETGKDIKDTGKGNQFMSGFDKVKPQNIDLGKLNSDQNKTADAGKASDSKGTGGGSGSYPSGGSSGSSGGAAGGGHDAKDAVGSGDKKKWSFGSFAGGGGGSATSGGGAGFKGSDGGLGQKDMDALQREIASEKIRAEVSGASGKSNWEKINERYLSNSSTLLSGK